MKLCEATLLTSAKKKEGGKKERKRPKDEAALKSKPGLGSSSRSYGKSAGSALQQRRGKELDERGREEGAEGGWR